MKAKGTKVARKYRGKMRPAVQQTKIGGKQLQPSPSPKNLRRRKNFELCLAARRHSQIAAAGVALRSLASGAATKPAEGVQLKLLTCAGIATMLV